ncbi:MAG: YlmH/Sll1252 family protein [Anaerococcus vaginalis]|uniref:YlmH/Sll1252 family protein n=1 Tax=Anaerococcus vaginalis TaxID=33037 RepID=UPI001897A6AA|nr:YlmH/Sll1252 family protein [Anaerococcus vaginalis]MDU5823541.1 YlmH/Sll1252 family protein [Anaerococcus vaginalis]MDU7649509.1 YlmH/Sll1252 family protein [Anaerococcus vaginalis]
MKLEYNIDFVEDKSVKANIKKAISLLEKSFYTRKEVSSFFLNPFEISVLNDIAKINNIEIVFLSCNESSERQIFVTNPYSNEINTRNYISVLEFKKNNIKHPDVLGALLNLGLERNDIGDIYVGDEICEFVVLNKDKDFVKFNLSKIKNERVNIDLKKDNILNLPKIDYIENRGFVSSLRLDNIVSEFINLSRSKAKILIQRRLVKVNYQIIDNPSKIIDENSLISIRREGRFIFDKVIGKSKKDNYHIEYRKYK